MSYSCLSPGFFAIDLQGRPVVEKSRKGNYTLVFLKQTDATEYCQQMCELRQVTQQNYKISTMPIYQIQRLLSYSQVQVCAIESWDKVIG